MIQFGSFISAVALVSSVALACQDGQTWQDCRNTEGSWMERHEEEYRDRQQREDAFFESEMAREMQRELDREDYENRLPTPRPGPIFPSYR